MQNVEFGPVLERLAGHDSGGVAAGKGQFAGIGLGVFDQLLDRFGRNAGVNAQHQRVASHPRDRGEVLHRIVADVLHQVGRRRMRAICAHEQRVAVRRRARDVKRRQRPVRARAVVDHDGLLERSAEVLSDHAGDRVGGAARPERNNHRDRLGRIGVGAGRSAEQHRAGDETAEQSLHAKVLPDSRL